MSLISLKIPTTPIVGECPVEYLPLKELVDKVNALLADNEDLLDDMDEFRREFYPSKVGRSLSPARQWLYNKGYTKNKFIARTGISNFQHKMIGYAPFTDADVNMIRNLLGNDTDEFLEITKRR